MIRHFTATIYILHEGKALLHFHEKLRRWLPPGGHVEENETPPEAALREAKEETGLEVSIVAQENLWVRASNASSFERPFLCLLEEIPARKDQPAHQHMDMIYVGRPVAAPGNDMPNGFRWFNRNELTEIESELFHDTKEVLNLLLPSA
ncbi:MAG: NUDIX domain-containing protein [Verrucomicrobia bacterium]|nr:NUDIX domain-containing protein [Verrucomicrobiota bacterium]